MEIFNKSYELEMMAFVYRVPSNTWSKKEKKRKAQIEKRNIGNWKYSNHEGDEQDRQTDSTTDGQTDRPTHTHRQTDTYTDRRADMLGKREKISSKGQNHP